MTEINFSFKRKEYVEVVGLTKWEKSSFKTVSDEFACSYDLIVNRKYHNALV